jgi:hypothetical protein
VASTSEAHLSRRGTRSRRMNDETGLAGYRQRLQGLLMAAETLAGAALVPSSVKALAPAIPARRRLDPA